MELGPGGADAISYCASSYFRRLLIGVDISVGDPLYTAADEKNGLLNDEESTSDWMHTINIITATVIGFDLTIFLLPITCILFWAVVMATQLLQTIK